MDLGLLILPTLASCDKENADEPNMPNEPEQPIDSITPESPNDTIIPNIDEYGIVVPNTGGNTEEGGDSGASMMIIVPALAATIYYIFRRFAIKKKSFGFEKHQN